MKELLIFIFSIGTGISSNIRNVMGVRNVIVAYANKFLTKEIKITLVKQ